MQAENSRDLKSDTEPFDEINIVKQGRHYGWPYCYNFKALSDDGSVWIVEDKNKTIIRLSKTADKIDMKKVSDEDAKRKRLAENWSQLERRTDLKSGF